MMIASQASAILSEFVRSGKLDGGSAVQVLSREEVAIVNLRTVSQHSGSGREFLASLKATGFRVRVRLPKRDALPFWRKMWKEGLIEDDPDTLLTWEQHTTALECQMTLDKSFLMSGDSFCCKDEPA